MMEHVQSENVRDTGVAKRKLLRVGNRVQPRAPHDVSRENIWRELLKKTRTGSDLERKSPWLTERQQTREKFLLVNAPQDGLLLPNAAVPEKLLVSLRIDSHSTFFYCTGFNGIEPRKLAQWFRRVTNPVDVAFG